MDTSIAYQIVEDTSPIAFYKPTRIIITREHYRMLLKAGVIKPKSGSRPYTVIGTVTKQQLQYQAARMADKLKALVHSLDDIALSINSDHAPCVTVNLK